MIYQKLSIYTHNSYNNEYALEYEDLVSGRGVVDLYKWVTHNKPDAPQEPTAVESIIFIVSFFQ